MAQPESNGKEQLSLEGATLQNDGVPVFIYYRDPTFDFLFSVVNGAIIGYYVLYSKKPANVALNVAGYLLLLAVLSYIIMDMYDFWIGRSIYSLVFVVVMACVIRYLNSKFRKKRV